MEALSTQGTNGAPGPSPQGPAEEVARVTGRTAFLRDIAFRFPVRNRVVWFALALMVVVCLVAAPAAFHQDSIRFIFALAGVLAIASTGQLLVVMLGGIDLSVPAVITFVGAIVVHQSKSANDDLTMAIVVAIAIALVIGLVNGLLVAVVKLNALIVTLAMAGVVLGVSLLWVGTNYSSSGTVPTDLGDFANRNVGAFSVIAIIGVVVIVAISLVLRSTRVGRSYVAAGTNPAAARVIGVRVTAYEVGGYVVAAGLYAVAGVLLAGLLRTPNESLGAPYQLQTIIAVALGGAALGGGPASVLGTLAACLFLGLVNQFLTLKGYSGGVKELVNGALLLLAVMLVSVSSYGRTVLRLFRSRRPRRRSPTDGAAPDGPAPEAT